MGFVFPQDLARLKKEACPLPKDNFPYRIEVYTMLKR